ncbi:MAG: transposase [Pirellulaceae bacterium]|nr:transposase [Pirellulaceae bacterium]
MQTWIEEELQTSDFRDQRLDRRYAVLMDELSQRPSVSIPNACGGWAETLAADGDPGDSSDACEVAWPPAAGPSLRGPTTQYPVLSTHIPVGPRRLGPPYIATRGSVGSIELRPHRRPDCFLGRSP